MSLPPAERGGAHLVLRARTQPRIVVAEDDDEMRRVVVQRLRHDGYDVVEAEDGAELLAFLLSSDDERREGIDLIVSDVRMPGASGVDVLEALRATDDTTPLILMTAFPDDTMRRRADDLGALLFDKPFDLDDLRIAVAALLRRRPGGAPLDSSTI